MTLSIALLGEYTQTFPQHSATNEAIEHAKTALGLEINTDWISTEDIEQTPFEEKL